MGIRKILNPHSFRDERNRDLLLFATLLFLSFFGLLVLYPASAVVSEKELGNAEYFVIRQAIWFVIGVLGLFIAANLPITIFRRFALPGILLVLGMLVLVFIPGVGHSVSSDRESFNRWIGVGPITIQPSEFAKIAIIVYVANILTKGEQLRSEYELKSLIPPALLTGLILGVIVIEPQYGTTICILGALIVLVYISGFPMLRLFFLFLASLPLLFLLGVLWEYRLDRFRVWLDPYSFRYSGGYQLVMSFRAFQEGGFFGSEIARGIGHRYLTYGHTDFILALIAEDFGLVGVIFLVGLYLLFIWRSWSSLKLITEPFPFMLGAGSMVMLVSQTILNMGVVTGLLPTTGVSLPFISYGGSSLITSLFFGGILVNVSRFARLQSSAVHGEIKN